eukprot:s600_g16.t1
MCDVLGPPSFVCPFQRYHVYRSRNAVFVFGIDKVRKEYSCLEIPKQEAASDAHPTLELRGGEERRELAGLDARLRDMRREHGLEEVALKASGLVGFIRFLCGHYLILIKTHKKESHHHVLSIESTALVPLFGDANKREEKNFKDQLNNLNLSKEGLHFAWPVRCDRPEFRASRLSIQ